MLINSLQAGQAERMAMINYLTESIEYTIGGSWSTTTAHSNSRSCSS